MKLKELNAYIGKFSYCYFNDVVFMSQKTMNCLTISW